MSTRADADQPPRLRRATTPREHATHRLRRSRKPRLPATTASWNRLRRGQNRLRRALDRLRRGASAASPSRRVENSPLPADSLPESTAPPDTDSGGSRRSRRRSRFTPPHLGKRSAASRVRRCAGGLRSSPRCPVASQTAATPRDSVAVASSCHMPRSAARCSTPRATAVPHLGGARVNPGGRRAWGGGTESRARNVTSRQPAVGCGYLTGDGAALQRSGDTSPE